MENQAEERLSELTREIVILKKGLECFDDIDEVKEAIQDAIKKREDERDQLINRLAFRDTLINK